MTRDDRGRIRIGLVLLILGALLVVFGAYVRAPRTSPPRRPISRVWSVDAFRAAAAGERADGIAAEDAPPVRFDPETVAERLRAFVRGPLRVTGTVVDADGLGVYGATVRIAPDGGAGEFDLSEVTEARTDGFGRFDATVPGEHRLVALHAAADDPAMGSATRRQIGTPKWGGLDVGAIALVPLDVVAGVVVDEDGAPIAGASVALHSVTGEGETFAATESDARGAFRIAAEFPSHPVLRAEAAGRVGALVRLAPPDPPLTIVLPRGRAVRGIVRSASGAGIAGARLWIASLGLFRDRESPILHSETDAAGTFDVAGVLPARFTIGAVADGFESGGTEVEADPSDAWVEIALEPAPLVRGIVVDEDGGHPLAGAEVHGASRPTGEDGRFEATARHPFSPAGEEIDVVYHIGAWKPGYVGASVTVAPSELAGEVRIALGRAARLEGLVLDSDGAPLVGARATIWYAQGPSVGAHVSVSGRFVEDGLPPGDVTISVSAQTIPRNDRAEAVALEAGKTSRVTIVVGHGRAVAGRVVDAVSGEPIARADVALWRNDGGKWFSDAIDRTDARGRFRIRGIGEGETRVVVRAETHVVRPIDVVLPPSGGDPAEVEIALEPGLSIVGRVVLEDGTPADSGSASVELENVEEPFASVHSRLQSDGTFEIRGLPPGRATLQAIAMGPDRDVRFGTLAVEIPSGPVEILVRPRER